MKTPSAARPASRSMAGFRAASSTGTGDGGVIVARNPSELSCRPAKLTADPVSAWRRTAMNSPAVPTGLTNGVPYQPSTMIGLLVPTPAMTRPGAQEASVAKPMAVSAGGRAYMPVMPLPILIEVVRAAIMPSRLNTSGPATSPASPSSTGSVIATRSGSGTLHLAEHSRGVVPDRQAPDPRPGQVEHVDRVEGDRPAFARRPGEGDLDHHGAHLGDTPAGLVDVLGPPGQQARVIGEDGFAALPGPSSGGKQLRVRLPQPGQRVPVLGVDRVEVGADGVAHPASSVRSSFMAPKENRASAGSPNAVMFHITRCRSPAAAYSLSCPATCSGVPQKA